MKLETLQITDDNYSDYTLPALDSENTLVLIFGHPDLINKPGIIADIAQQYPKSHILGCSTSGEIFADKVFDSSLSIAVMQFEKTKLKSTFTAIDSVENSFNAGVEVTKELFDPSLNHVFVLSGGLDINGSELVNGINSQLPDNVMTTGGLASDGTRLSRPWIIREGQIVEGWVSAVGFYGDHIQIGHGSRGGWDFFGLERIITRSDGNILYEINGKPALQLYKDYLGDYADDLPATGLLFPLSLRSDLDSDERIVRTILSVNEDEQSIIFAGDVPQGYHVQFMMANFDRIIEGAYDAGCLAELKTGDNPILSLAISCVGRRLVLRDRTDEELEALISAFSSDVKQIGFYSLGEISPFVPLEGACALHNQTMTVTTICEI